MWNISNVDEQRRYIEEQIASVVQRLEQALGFARLDVLLDRIDDVTDIASKADTLIELVNIKDDLNALATNLADFKEAAKLTPYMDKYVALYGELSHLVDIFNNLSNIVLVANDLTNVDIVANDKQNVDIVASIKDNVNIVASEKDNIDAVVQNKTNIDTAANYILQIVETANNIQKIINVSDNIGYVKTVSQNISDVQSVGQNIDDVSSVASIKSNVVTVSNDKTNIDIVAGDKTNIDTVAGDITNVRTTAQNISSVNSVASDIDNINDVNANKTNIDTVATNISKVNNVSSKIAAVQNVNDNMQKIVSVDGNEQNINTIADNIGNISAVSQDIANIDSVASDLNNINAVKSNESNINSVASNMQDIQTTASNIDDIVTAAQNITDIHTFTKVYLGAKSEAPTTRDDGSSLQAGDIYFDTTNSTLNTYDGSTWVVIKDTSQEALLKTNNLSDINDVVQARSNIDVYSKSESDSRFEHVSNKVSSFGTTPTDDHYPTEKLVKDSIDNIQSQITSNDTDISNLQTSKADKGLSNVNDSDILNKLKNVDGNGSGLDADLVRGRAIFNNNRIELPFVQTPIIVNGQDMMKRKFYVDAVNGDDNNDGSSESPFRTIKKAIDSVPIGGYGSIAIGAGQEYVLDSIIEIHNKIIKIKSNRDNKPTIKTTYSSATYKYLNYIGLVNSTLICDGIHFETYNGEINQSRYTSGLIGRVNNGAFGCVNLYSCDITINTGDVFCIAFGGSFLDIQMSGTSINRVDSGKILNIESGKSAAALTVDGSDPIDANDIIGLVKDSNGTPRNVVSNLIL